MQFCKDRNRMMVMDIFKDKMVRNFHRLIIHYQARQIIALVRRKSKAERVAAIQRLPIVTFRHCKMLKLLHLNRIFFFMHINRHHHIARYTLQQVGGLQLHSCPVQTDRIYAIAVTERFDDKGCITAADDGGA